LYAVSGAADLSESSGVSRILASLLTIHLTGAAAATIAFWIAAALRKGGRGHRAAGRWFSRLVYLTAITGAVMAVARLLGPPSLPLIDGAGQLLANAAMELERQTMWLVLYVLLILVAPVQHGLAVVPAGAEPRLIRSRWHITLNLVSMVASVALVPAALLWQRWHFLIVAPIGLVVGLRQIAYAARPRADRREWEREHLTSLLTAGVTLHTALFVFGTTRSLGLPATGPASWWPWLAPALIGLPIMLWLRTRRA
jgi:hypothetical protein